MVFGFFKRKDAPKQLPPPDLEEAIKLLSSGEQQVPSTQPPSCSHAYEEEMRSQTQQTQGGKSLFNVLTSPSAKEFTFEGRTFHLEDITLAGQPTRNFVIGHPLKPFQATIISQKERYVIMPVGALYFSESFSLNDVVTYRVQCHMHKILLERFHNHKFYDRLLDALLDAKSFLSNLKGSLRDLAPVISGSELRIYEEN